MIGLEPRSLSWIIPHRLAIAERPGGAGRAHRRIRREEEICWLSKNGFEAIISFRVSPHNLDAYEQLGLNVVHVPVGAGKAIRHLSVIFEVLDSLLRVQEKKTLAHCDDIDDQLVGMFGAYLLHLGLVEDHPQAVATIEALTYRPLGPEGRALIQSVSPKAAVSRVPRESVFPKTTPPQL